MGLRSQTPAKKMRAYIKAVLFTIELKSAVSKKRFIMNFKLLMDRYKNIERSISNVPPTHKQPHHNIKIPSLLNSSSEEEGGITEEEEEEVDIIMSSIPPGLEHVSEQEWQELIMASAHASSQSDVEGSGSSALEGEGSSGSWDVNYETEKFIRRNRERMMKENREEFSRRNL